MWKLTVEIEREGNYGKLHETMNFEFEELECATEFIETVQAHSMNEPVFTLVHEREEEQAC